MSSGLLIVTLGLFLCLLRFRLRHSCTCAGTHSRSSCIITDMNYLLSAKLMSMWARSSLDYSVVRTLHTPELIGGHQGSDFLSLGTQVDLT